MTNKLLELPRYFFILNLIDKFKFVSGGPEISSSLLCVAQVQTNYLTEIRGQKMLSFRFLICKMPESYG